MLNIFNRMCRIVRILTTEYNSRSMCSYGWHTVSIIASNYWGGIHYDEITWGNMLTKLWKNTIYRYWTASPLSRVQNFTDWGGFFPLFYRFSVQVLIPRIPFTAVVLRSLLNMFATCLIESWCDWEERDEPVMTPSFMDFSVWPRPLPRDPPTLQILTPLISAYQQCQP